MLLLCYAAYFCSAKFLRAYFWRKKAYFWRCETDQSTYEMQKPLYLLLSINVYTQYTWMCVGVWFWVRVSATAIHLSLFLHTFEKFCELEIWKLCELEQRAASGVYGSAGVIKVPVPTGGRKYLLGTPMQCWSTGARHCNAMLVDWCWAQQCYAGNAILCWSAGGNFPNQHLSHSLLCDNIDPQNLPAT